MDEQNKKPEYEEIEIDLNKHDLEISSKKEGPVYISVDGESVTHAKQFIFMTPFINAPEDMSKRTLRMIIHHPERR